MKGVLAGAGWGRAKGVLGGGGGGDGLLGEAKKDPAVCNRGWVPFETYLHIRIYVQLYNETERTTIEKKEKGIQNTPLLVE